MHVYVMLVEPRGAEKCQEQQAEHVERSEARGQNAKSPQQRAGALRGEKNLVLAEEPGKSRRAGNRECSHEHRPESPRNFLAQTAHLAHVLFAAHRVNHAACRKKQQSLEERMRHQMEYTGAESSHTAGQEHVAELRHRRVRQNFFDISLYQANCRGE